MVGKLADGEGWQVIFKLFMQRRRGEIFKHYSKGKTLSKIYNSN